MGGDSNNQYTLTVNKDSNVSSVTVKVGTATLSPKTSGGNTYWVDKGSNPTISATAKSGYKIKSGIGSTEIIEAGKIVDITSKVITVSVQIIGPTEGGKATTRITVNGVDIPKSNNIIQGTYNLKAGDVIIIYGNPSGSADRNWTYECRGTNIGYGNTIKCVVPSIPESSDGAYGYIHTGDWGYNLYRSGACSNWVFNLT